MLSLAKALHYLPFTHELLNGWLPRHVWGMNLAFCYRS